MDGEAVFQISRHPFLDALLKLCPDKLYIKLKWYGRRMPYRLNLKKPRTFSEKLQWIKIYDHNPLYTTLVDKYKVKEYVANRIGPEYVVPLYGVWDSIEDIDWESLPKRFVIKTNHDCGGLIICTDKEQFDVSAAKEKLSRSLNRDYYYESREWPYKNVERKIFAEAYLEDGTGDLKDYKFFCFNGEPKYCQVISGRNTNMCIDFFDKEWNHQVFHEPYWYPFADVGPIRPINYDKMWELAGILAHGKPFSRIDFYDVNGNIYFGEITFFPTGGMGGFDPIEWDYKFGEWITLPSLKTDK